MIDVGDLPNMSKDDLLKLYSDLEKQPAGGQRDTLLQQVAAILAQKGHHVLIAESMVGAPPKTSF